MTRKLIALACFFSATAQAASFNSLDALSQAQFKSFAENVSAATQYKAIAPAEPLGVIGLDVGVSVSYTPAARRVPISKYWAQKFAMRCWKVALRLLRWLCEVATACCKVWMNSI